MIAVSLNGASLSYHPGYIIAFLGCLGWAVYSGLRPLVPAGPQASMAMFTLIAGLATIPLHLAFGHPFVAPPCEVLAAFIMGAVPVGLANLLWDQGARDGDPVLLAGVAFVEPIVSTLLIVLILGKPYDEGDVVGLLLVIAGIGAAVLGERARRRAT
jgi:drug/metabolite transporter (DMT)-like permease